MRYLVSNGQYCAGKRPWLFWLVLSLAVSLQTSSSSAQSEVDQAVELLKLAVKCPVPPYEIIDDSYRSKILEEHSYEGDETVFRLKTNRTIMRLPLQGGPPSTLELGSEWYAPFFDFKRATVWGSTVTLDCGSRWMCVASATQQIWNTQMRFRTCDSEQATNIQIAAQILIGFAAHTGQK